MFQAVRRVAKEGDHVDLEFMPAEEPACLEVSPKHFVACYLYTGPKPAA